MTLTRRALIIQYDGSRFFGFQKQEDGRQTVQAALENALSQLAQERIAIIAAGRTDTGVHASGQVVHFDSRANRPDSAWVRGVNARLPEGIAVQSVHTVAPHFHARFDASGRHYRYLLQSSPVRSPLLLRRVGWTHCPLNIAPMRQALQHIVGQHDFSSFRAAQCQAKSPIKTLYRADIAQNGDLFAIDLHGNAFLHHMVRNIVGALVYIGSGRLTVADFVALIAAKSRLAAPPTFMADGLYFTGVDYPADFGLPAPSLPTWLQWPQQTDDSPPAS